MTGPLVIDGRLDEAKAASYLVSVRATRTIAAFVISADEEEGPRHNYERLYEYFHSRAKYGVIKHRSPLVKDAYIVTLSTQDPIPDYLPLTPAQQALLRDFQSRTEHVVLGVYVVKPAPPPAVVAAASSLNISKRDSTKLESYFAEHPEVADDPSIASNPQQLLSILERYQDRAARS
jgi:hypothetical protein